MKNRKAWFFLLFPPAAGWAVVLFSLNGWLEWLLAVVAALGVLLGSNPIGALVEAYIDRRMAPHGYVPCHRISKMRAAYMRPVLWALGIWFAPALLAFMDIISPWWAR